MYQSKHLSKLKSHNNMESLNQTALLTSKLTLIYTPKFGTQVFTSTLHIPLKIESNTIMFIPFNSPLVKTETIQQNNDIKL